MTQANIYLATINIYFIGIILILSTGEKWKNRNYVSQWLAMRWNHTLYKNQCQYNNNCYKYKLNNNNKTSNKQAYRDDNGSVHSLIMSMWIICHILQWRHMHFYPYVTMCFGHPFFSRLITKNWWRGSVYSIRHHCSVSGFHICW